MYCFFYDKISIYIFFCVLAIPHVFIHALLLSNCIPHEFSPLSEFGDPEKAQEKPTVGSDCFVWSYTHSSWCRAKIVKISEDYVKVCLVNFNIVHLNK